MSNQYSFFQRKKKNKSDQQATTKRILDGVSGVVKPGEILGILGPSGAGKTSLLDVLSGRNNVGEVFGSICVNGKEMAPGDVKKVGTYVKQSDLLMGTLTVRETFEFNAELRLPGDMSKEEKMKRVDKIITQLQMERCADALVGNAQVRGISGGEKRRVTIGAELITDPELIFLDEPSSGLDANIAQTVMDCLFDAVRKDGRTAICTSR
eukprot:TRINITY_DN3183_c0_g5_i1.p1 TRINITY_DN3183_c0_g5~~TRINITY_DN3183_c0_g5_i1.p1  ORF type:complete len:243 (-),score=69.26 TRINITY_DN3183_c0_g5_i1:25-651(-)